MLEISHYENQTELLGPGRRFALWVHGCCFDCEGCLAQNIKFGGHTRFTCEQLGDIILSSDTDGITISGGEPFLQAAELAKLIKYVRQKRDVGVIIYTGFTMEELGKKEEASELLAQADILIDGRYIKDLDDGRAYVGSSNQRIIYLTERYKETGAQYYAAVNRRAEIKFTRDRVMLIGVPSANALKIWNDIKLKAGGQSQKNEE